MLLVVVNLKAGGADALMVSVWWTVRLAKTPRFSAGVECVAGCRRSRHQAARFEKFEKRVWPFLRILLLVGGLTIG